MIASERSHQDISEAILTLLAPCEGIVKFRHTLLVTKNVKSIGGLFQCVKKSVSSGFIKKYSSAKSS